MRKKRERRAKPVSPRGGKNRSGIGESGGEGDGDADPWHRLFQVCGFVGIGEGAFSGSHRGVVSIFLPPLVCVLFLIFPNFKIGDCFKTSVSSTDFFDDAALWHLFDSLITIFAWYKFHFFILVFSLLSIPS